MTQLKQNPKSTVFVTAYSEGGDAVEEVQLHYDEYYGGLSPLIDSDEYRAERGIVRLTIKVFNSDGAVQSEFENFYGREGEYRTGRAVLADGTVVDM